MRGRVNLGTPPEIPKDASFCYMAIAAALFMHRRVCMVLYTIWTRHGSARPNLGWIVLLTR